MISEHELILMLWEGHTIIVIDDKYRIADLPIDEQLMNQLRLKGFLSRRRNGEYTLSRLGCELAFERAEGCTANNAGADGSHQL